MCLIAWNWQPASPTPLLLLANRDEFYGRAARALHWWDDGQVLAGRDVQAGGTWLGVSRSGKLAALTNYRSAVPPRDGTPSRGELVADFLKNKMSAAQYVQALAPRAGDYNPFNLLVYDGTQLLGLESRSARVLALPAGIGAVSNADFQTPWPKLTRLTTGLQSCLEQGTADTDKLMALLHDRSIAPDEQLPQTGVPLALERALSATFIAMPGYGTRACSVVKIHPTHAEFTEQGYEPGGQVSHTQQGFPL